jgi:hypothetical protein
VKKAFWKLGDAMFTADVDDDVDVGFGIGGTHGIGDIRCSGRVVAIDRKHGGFRCTHGCIGAFPKRWATPNPDIPHELRIESLDAPDEVVYGTAMP